jgi:hypothetical protein
MPRFVPSELDPHRMIAAATLDTIRALLRGSGPHRRPTDAGPLPRVTVRLEDHPILDRIGGVARVDPGPGGAVGIARVSRSSFVAFELGADGLHELPVQVDDLGSTLHIDRAITQMAGGRSNERPR